MPYEHNVFISYNRYAQWPTWVEKHFLPIFEHWLGVELGSGRDAGVFWDKHLETGRDYPMELARKLATSRIIIPLLSRRYFNSLWCRTELAHIYARESSCGLGRKSRSGRLIVPAILHDSEDMPDAIRIIQAIDLREYSNPFLTDNSPKREALSEMIRAWIPDVVGAIHRAPAHDPAWVDLAIDDFLKPFQVPEAKQVTVPTLGLS